MGYGAGEKSPDHHEITCFLCAIRWDEIQLQLESTNVGSCDFRCANYTAIVMDATDNSREEETRPNNFRFDRNTLANP